MRIAAGIVKIDISTATVEALRCDLTTLS